MPVTAEAGAYSQVVPLSLMDGLTDIDRRRIVNLPDDVIQGLAGADIPTIARTLLVTQAQATQLHAAIAAGQAAVLALAQAQVNAALSRQCRWYNPALTSVCPPGAACPGATGGPYPENGVGWTVPCGRFSSTTSQEEATAQAQDLLCRETVCVWKNVERTVYCRGRGVEVDPDAAPVPPGTASGGWDPLYTTGGDRAGGTQTGSLTVPAGTYTSVVSQEDADRQAPDFAPSRPVSFRMFPHDARRLRRLRKRCSGISAK